MKPRQLAREFVFKFVYQKFFNGDKDLPENLSSELEDFFQMADLPLQEKDFAQNVIQSLVKSHDEIEGLIEKNLNKKSLNKVTKVDKAILSVGICEMVIISPPTPKAVIINECVEISKKYGQESSHSFINAVLDKIKQ